MRKLLAIFAVGVSLANISAPAAADEQLTCPFDSSLAWLENGRTSDGVPINRHAMRDRLVKIAGSEEFTALRAAAVEFTPQIIASAPLHHPCTDLIRQITADDVLQVAGVTAPRTAETVEAVADRAESTAREIERTESQLEKTTDLEARNALTEQLAEARRTRDELERLEAAAARRISALEAQRSVKPLSKEQLTALAEAWDVLRDIRDLRSAVAEDLAAAREAAEAAEQAKDAAQASAEESESAANRAEAAANEAAEAANKAESAVPPWMSDWLAWILGAIALALVVLFGLLFKTRSRVNTVEKTQSDMGEELDGKVGRDELEAGFANIAADTNRNIRHTRSQLGFKDVEFDERSLANLNRIHRENDFDCSAKLRFEVDGTKYSIPVILLGDRRFAVKGEPDLTFEDPRDFVHAKLRSGRFYKFQV